jgi:hypothetical protein
MNELDNTLVHQKDYIRSLINDGKYDEANMLLAFVKELWVQAAYVYKYVELKNILIAEVRNKLHTATHWKERAKWEAKYKKVLF